MNRTFESPVLRAEGLRPAPIAQTLPLSIKTMSTHKMRATAELSARLLTDLIRYAIRQRPVGWAASAVVSEVLIPSVPSPQARAVSTRRHPSHDHRPTRHRFSRIA